MSPIDYLGEFIQGLALRLVGSKTRRISPPRMDLYLEDKLKPNFQDYWVKIRMPVSDYSVMINHNYHLNMFK